MQNQGGKNATVGMFAGVSWLRAEHNRGYGLLPIPSARDQQIAELLNRWVAMDSDTRHQAAAAVEAQQGPTLLAFAERMASLAVRRRDAEIVKLGLVAVGLQEGAGAKREGSVVVLGLLFRASQKLESNVSSRFVKAARLLPPQGGRALLLFCRRPPRDRMIETMGYLEAREPDGFRFTAIPALRVAEAAAHYNAVPRQVTL